jgi:hypothetical protein
MPNEQQWKSLEDAVRRYADLLGLKDWRIEVMREHPKEDSDLGECRVIYGRRMAQILFCQSFFEVNPEEQRSTIIHELLHCHFDSPFQEAAKLQDHVNPAVWHVFHASYHERTELVVDTIAEAIGRLMPLPGLVSNASLSSVRE